jgi:hypothetical protein
MQKDRPKAVFAEQAIQKTIDAGGGAERQFLLAVHLVDVVAELDDAVGPVPQAEI